MQCPGIEHGSTAWKAAMLTTIPTSLDEKGGQIAAISKAATPVTFC